MSNVAGRLTLLRATVLTRPGVQVLSILPQLEKLDEQPVSSDEVSAARRLYPDLPPAPQSPAPSARASTSYGPCCAYSPAPQQIATHSITMSGRRKMYLLRLM